MPAVSEEPIFVCQEDLAELRELLASMGSARDREQIERLESELDRAVVVKASELPGDVVRMHSWVEFENERTLRRQRVKLVYPSEADPAQGRVSVFAPLGAALLGLRVGQSLDWPIPSGWVRVKILDVQHPEEPAPQPTP